MLGGRCERQRSIVTQTVLRVSGVFIAVLVLATALFTFYIGVYMRDNILESRRREVDTVALAMESMFNRLAEPMILLAEYEHTSRLLTGYYEEYSTEWLNSVRGMDAYLQSVNIFTDCIIDINLLDVQTKGVYSLKDILSMDYAYGQQQWFLGALEKEGVVKYAPPHGSDHLYPKNMGTTFSMIYPVNRAGQLIGYVIMECDLYRIADFPGSGESDAGYLLLDDVGELICSDSDDTVLSDGSADFDGIMQGQTRIAGDEQKLYVSHRIRQNRWMVVLETDKEVMLHPVRRLFFMIGLLALLAVFVLSAVNIYHIKIMEKPFNALIQRIKSYDGSAAECVPEYDHEPRELAVIRDQFEAMADKMNGLIQDIYVARLRQKESELEALTNQLNPHFLYNVFQTIQTKAVLVDNQEIEELIQALSMMMRYTMERKRDRVKIQDEIAYTKNYLMFYKVRFPKLFDYTVECPDELLAYRTLKFVLQPVVENCFKHAFKDRTAGGFVRISVKEAGCDIVFEITDNGAGMGQERLSEMQKKISWPSAEGGIGILNTNARLRLVYGSEYGLKIESVEREYTKVTVRIRKEGGQVV